MSIQDALLLAFIVFAPLAISSGILHLVTWIKGN
jgi:hypothetical protein